MSLVTALFEVLPSALSLLIGLAIGKRLRPKADPAAPLCTSCGDGYGVHDEQGKCHGENRRPRYDSFGERCGYAWVPCRCLRYTGPLPLDTIWVPPRAQP